MEVVWLLVFVACATAQGNPDENQGIQDSNLVEGDMILNAGQKLAAKLGMDVDSPMSRGSIRTKHWPGGVLVYQIAPTLTGNSRAISAIQSGMKMWTDNTCIRFKKRTTESAYVYFHIGQGCSSEVGTQSRLQYLSLASGCWSPGIVAHEIGHALGFYHEQSRPDRDNYVTIYENNIQKGMDFNFNKYPRSTIDSLGTPYDYGSIMHYGPTAFGINGRITMAPKQQGVTFGQRTYISKIDIQQMNLLYKCSGGGGDGGGGGGSSCADNNQHCAHWAGIGECQKNSDFMLANCKKSCNQCSCTDGDKNCSYWAGIGECQKNASWMNKNCKKSCNQC